GTDDHGPRRAAQHMIQRLIRLFLRGELVVSFPAQEKQIVALRIGEDHIPRTSILFKLLVADTGFRAPPRESAEPLLDFLTRGCHSALFELLLEPAATNRSSLRAADGRLVNNADGRQQAFVLPGQLNPEVDGRLAVWGTIQSNKHASKHNLIPTPILTCTFAKLGKAKRKSASSAIHTRYSYLYFKIHGSLVLFCHAFNFRCISASTSACSALSATFTTSSGSCRRS